MIGKRLVELRGKRTQKEVANQLEISRARYSHYETNHVEPNSKLLQKLSDYYGVTVDYLLGRSDSELSNREKEFLENISSVPLDKVIQKYPLEFMGEQLDLTSDDRRAILAFIKTLQDLKK